MIRWKIQCRVARILGLIVVCAGWFAGCSTGQYRYVPTDSQVPISKGRGEAIYKVPSVQAPTGQVRIISMGIVDLKPTSGKDKVPALTLRVALSNFKNGNSEKDQSWMVNPNEQSISFPNEQQVKPLLATSDSISTPQMTIKPGELRVLDLFFPTPVMKDSESKIPEFDFHWQIQAGNKKVKGTTPFDRIEIYDPPQVIYPYTPYPYYTYGYGWGGPYSW